ncbi:MAG: type I restriction-modification system subunit M [Deltaproteobacteria bacterium]|jgi:type I restriction enzyme M protein|nr:type I restriction-modification system subunit M [Deltaproteobacteria bacterium]
MPKNDKLFINQTQQSLEKYLWEAADKLRKNIDAAEYKHIVLGLIFLKYISDSFDELSLRFKDVNFGKLPLELADGVVNSSTIIFVPPLARWENLLTAAKKPNIGRLVDRAMETIENQNPQLKGVLPKVYARLNLDPATLGGLIDLVSNISLGEAKEQSSDVLGHVFEYFLGEFALGEGKKGGQFYTPRSIVELLVEMLEPYQGKVFDPCCGSGGMFVQSEKFVIEHQGQVNNISLYGQESNLTTWRLAKMNLAIRKIDSSLVKWNHEGSFLNDAHHELKADYIIANPPFNDSDWSGEQLRENRRWQYGVPPVGNANFAWLQHFVHHLSPNGQAGIVLAKGALTSNVGGEGDIRRRMVEEGNLVDCIVNLPTKLFLNTQIPAALWFLSLNRKNGQFRNRSQEILFIDARDLGELINRRTRILTKKDILQISSTYHNWRNSDGHYEDIKGFCCSAPVGNVVDMNCVLTPGRYVGLPEVEDEIDYEERFLSLRGEFLRQTEEEKRLNAKIIKALSKIKI